MHWIEYLKRQQEHAQSKTRILDVFFSGVCVYFGVSKKQCGKMVRNWEQQKQQQQQKLQSEKERKNVCQQAKHAQHF